MSLLISTVLEGLEIQTRAGAGTAVHDARDRGPVLGADDEHIASIPIGDDLLLQVLRRVLAAKVRLQRSAQPRPLLAQTVPNASQLRARIVYDLAAGIDLLANVGDLTLERRRGVGDAAQVRNGPASAADT